MPNPGPPDIQSLEPWWLHTAPGGPTADFYFDVAGPPSWSRPEGDGARMATPLCGGPPTLLSLGAGLPKRRFRVTVRLQWGPNRNARLAALETAWAARGPFLLTAPPISPSDLTVIFDPSQGPLEYTVDVGARTVLVAFQEQ